MVMLSNTMPLAGVAQQIEQPAKGKVTGLIPVRAHTWVLQAKSLWGAYENQPITYLSHTDVYLPFLLSSSLSKINK